MRVRVLWDPDLDILAFPRAVNVGVCQEVLPLFHSFFRTLSLAPHVRDVVGHVHFFFVFAIPHLRPSSIAPLEGRPIYEFLAEPAGGVVSGEVLEHQLALVGVGSASSSVFLISSSPCCLAW